MASKLRDGMRVVQDLTQRAAVAAELLPRLAGESSTRMMPFAEHGSPWRINCSSS